MYKDMGPVDLVEAQTFVLKFGRYQGKTLAEVLIIDPKYFIWLAHNCQVPKVRRMGQKILSVSPQVLGSKSRKVE